MMIMKRVIMDRKKKFLMGFASNSFRYECNDCIFKHMKTIRLSPGRMGLLLALQIILHSNGFAQMEYTSSSHTFVPLPDIMIDGQGNRMDIPEQWNERRRGEVLEQFRDHVYGRVPDAKISITHHVRYLNENALGGSAIQKEGELQVNNGSEALSFSILIFLPKETQVPVPLFLGLNFYGNHTIHPDDQITIPTSWVRNNKAFGIKENMATEASRGVRSSRWPVELILSRGYGLATIYYGDIDPDFHDGFENGIHKLFFVNGPARDSSAWGSIAAWAWGLSRTMDYFETDPDVDHERVAVIGHSRLGKTSLWAGAQDERFGMVISNNSGCGGAALSRRTFGERVNNINSNFPHWFASRFHAYNDHESLLPVDQHMLMALIAPRPLYVASAKEDDWADPHGEYLSLFYGSTIYELLGKRRLKSPALPELDKPLYLDVLGYHIRSGKHDLTRYDWEQYLDFADLHLAR